MTASIAKSASLIAHRPAPSKYSAEERAKKLEDLGFGRIYAENMVTIAYDADQGWHDAQLVPYSPLSLDPAASVLHYGQAIFEGFKAYRQVDGGIATFRPEANAARFVSSAERLAMPPLPQELFIAAADALIRQEQDWVPPRIGESLYLRPLMIATEAGLGVRPAREYLFLLIASPSGAYFPQGIKPVSVWVSKDYIRAAPGGTGHTKCAGNYAASLVAQRQAKEQGCDQVIWLDALHREYIEEMGGMNLFFVYQEPSGTKIVTPALSGSLLPGVTRDSLLQLAADLGIEAEERALSLTQFRQDLESGKMTEVFACGTAAVITPVGEVKSGAFGVTVNGGETGPIAEQLRKALLDIQHGAVPDQHGWCHRVV